MPYAIVWSESEVHKQFSGLVSGREFIQSVRDISSDKRFGELKLVINDFSLATAINIERLTILHAASLTSGVRDINPVVRVAFIVPPGEVGADVREILAPLMAPRYRVGVFETVEEVRTWE